MRIDEIIVVELAPPKISLSRSAAGWVYSFVMDDDATFEVLFAGDKKDVTMSLARKETSGSFWTGRTTSWRTHANKKPVANPRHGYASEVYAAMFESLSRFLRDAEPEMVTFMASAERQVQPYKDLLAKIDLRGYSWRAEGSNFLVFRPLA